MFPSFSHFCFTFSELHFVCCRRKVSRWTYPFMKTLKYSPSILVYLPSLIAQYNAILEEIWESHFWVFHLLISQLSFIPDIESSHVKHFKIVHSTGVNGSFPLLPVCECLFAPGLCCVVLASRPHYGRFKSFTQCSELKWQKSEWSLAAGDRWRVKTHELLLQSQNSVTWRHWHDDDVIICDA